MNQGRTFAAVLALAGLAAVGVSTAAAAQGAEKASAEDVYKVKCQVCHAADGNSPMPNMSFADGVWRHGSTVKDLANTITNGVKGTAMMPFKGQLTDAEILALAKYVRQFDKKLKK